jgi:hypothetical protein
LGIALAAFLIALPIFGMVLHGGRLGMLDYGILGRAGRGMMILPFFGILGFVRVLFPLGVVALAIVGIVLLARGKHTSPTPPPATPAQPAVEGRTCRHCGKPLHAEGEYCPHCGKKQ